MFAGNLEGKTQTLTLAVYTTFESDMGAAQALSLVSADARVVGVASQLANKHHTLTLNVKVSG